MYSPGLTFITIALVGLTALAAPSKTELVHREGKWTLLRDGQPFLIKGVGGSGSKKLLADLGGNSFRTWGTENLQQQLDEAQSLGLAVAVGIWLKHERHGFDYNDADFVAGQLARVRDDVTRYKDHPAILLWALGNEMEGEKGDDAAIWSHIDSCAALVKQIDPTRPTMTVIAELGGDKVKNLHRLCPNIDIVGINSYAGASSVIKRYRELGGTKPVVITEFGPFGTWEVGRNDFDALPEPTANEKAEQYRRHYAATVGDADEIVLGSYAFTWGAKLEMTHTWFGMLLPDGNKLPAVDAVSGLWSGKPPANRCPSVSSIDVGKTQRVSPGATIQAAVTGSDPDGDPLRFEWQLWGEVAKPGIGGDAEEAPPSFPQSINATMDGKATVTMPSAAGRYRLYVFVRDGKGSASTANVPLLVESSASGSN